MYDREWPIWTYQEQLPPGQVRARRPTANAARGQHAGVGRLHHLGLGWSATRCCSPRCGSTPSAEVDQAVLLPEVTWAAAAAAPRGDRQRLLHPPTACSDRPRRRRGRPALLRSRRRRGAGHPRHARPARKAAMKPRPEQPDPLRLQVSENLSAAQDRRPGRCQWRLPPALRSPRVRRAPAAAGFPFHAGRRATRPSGAACWCRSPGRRRPPVWPRPATMNAPLAAARTRRRGRLCAGRPGPAGPPRQPLRRRHKQPYGDNGRRFAALGWAAAQLAQGWTPTGSPEWCTATTGTPGWCRLPAARGRRPAAAAQRVHRAQPGLPGRVRCGPLPELGLPDRCSSMQGLEFWGQVSFMKAGLHYANRITTVSPTYAREIQTARTGLRARRPAAPPPGDLSGILNGVDDAVWNPATDPHLPHPTAADTAAGKAAAKPPAAAKPACTPTPTRRCSPWSAA
jgi:hypothetical protein